LAKRVSTGQNGTIKYKKHYYWISFTMQLSVKT